MGSMNERKFLEQYAYALEYDFMSSSEEPAAWAPNHPRYWSQEMANISLDKSKHACPHGVEEAIHVFQVGTQERLEVLRRHTVVVETVQSAAGVVYNSESQSKFRYMLVSEGDVENKHMVIMWELDKHGKLITSASIHT
ncbi:hypothetical protein N7467_012193 [Penicillium canescens]|nr:hypothetical protein N7467_012193 [Penicillium canescens]